MMLLDLLPGVVRTPASTERVMFGSSEASGSESHVEHRGGKISLQRNGIQCQTSKLDAMAAKRTKRKERSYALCT